MDDNEDSNKNDKKRKRVSKGGIGNEKAECWNRHRYKWYEKHERALPYDFNPENQVRLKQAKLSLMKDVNGDGAGSSSGTGTLQNWKYDEKVLKNSLIELIVLPELPFKFVEHPTFIRYSKNLQPKYNLPSRHTISRDVSKFYLEEKKKIVKFLGNPNNAIHLTTDTWTSTCQKINYMVQTIGLAVKYIKGSSQRIEKFKESIKSTCDSKSFLVSECPTRWNSTYDMLESAIDLQDAFYNYSMNKASFARDLETIPRRKDFDVCQKVCDFLKKFKEKTELVSNQSSPVAHLFYSEILDVDKHLREWELEVDFSQMVSKMRLNYYDWLDLKLKHVATALGLVASCYCTFSPFLVPIKRMIRNCLKCSLYFAHFTV
ncbi:zinc finger BED domain-containing protein RICESLEEPER 2 [Artemisia annua]|uniref:Zinc finger BED domain-containing protein RICESLEEPER 2 n=1 Tax=Artemisia annua TaxID=35608 RepID=A0A2U1LPA3_ARTAN|nr:zinc finger BED domain-containing protein RICESLEEPER 2 [Artemisia annua]